MMHQGSTAIAGKTAITAKAVGGDPMSVMFNAGELEISAVLSGEPLGARGQLNEGSFAIFNLLRSSDKVAHLEWEKAARQKVSAICGTMP